MPTVLEEFSYQSSEVWWMCHFLVLEWVCWGEIYEHIRLTGRSLECLRISWRDTPRTSCGFLFFLRMWCDFHGLFVIMLPWRKTLIQHKQPLPEILWNFQFWKSELKLPALNTLQTKYPLEETASSYWAQIVLFAMRAILGMPENSDVVSRYFDAMLLTA